MKKTLLIALAVLFTLGLVMSPAAEARVFVGVGVGCCYGGYYGGYGYPYYPYYAPYYVAPPPVVYSVPPAPAPTVVYQQAAPTTYSAPPPPAPAPVAMSAPAAAAPAPDTTTFIDSQGRTCRHIQATPGQPYATACLQPDGTWHTVQ